MPLFLLLVGVAAAVAFSRSSGSPSAAWGPSRVPQAAELDPGMPPELVSTVQAAVRTETSAANLRSFADAIAPYYPIAAKVLRARAGALS